MPVPLSTGTWIDDHQQMGKLSQAVQTATFLSSGKAKNLTSYRIKIPDPIEIKFGMVDYVGESAPSAKFQANPHEGGFSAHR